MRTLSVHWVAAAGSLLACTLASSATLRASSLHGPAARHATARHADPAGGAARVVDAGTTRLIAPEAAAPAVARLQWVHSGGVDEAWADNLLDGPIEVMLEADSADAPRAEPRLPARATVPTRTRVLVTRVASSTGATGPPRLVLRAVVGPPGAHARDVEYGYPLGTDELRIGQAWDGGFSHADAQNRHAVDFATPIGTQVLAARDGTVMHLESRYREAVPGAGEAMTRANFVRVIHEDGSMALYAHLDADGVLVRQGQRVRRGEPLARSGNTGLSSGPHLHFAVQVNRGFRLESVPFRMFGPQGILRFQP